MAEPFARSTSSTNSLASVPAIEVDISLGGLRVARVLDRIAEERGYPEAIVDDNRPVFTSRALERQVLSSQPFG